MHTENFVINNSSESQVVENVCTVSPNVDRAELPKTLIVEAVDLCDLPALVVSPDEGYSLWVSDLECHEEQECLHRVGSSVNEVTHEKIVRIWTLSTNFKELLQVIELPVNISANL